MYLSTIYPSVYLLFHSLSFSLTEWYVLTEFTNITDRFLLVWDTWFLVSVLSCIPVISFDNKCHKFFASPRPTSRDPGPSSTTRNHCRRFKKYPCDFNHELTY